MAHREIDRVPIDALEGRITAMLVTPYPPGIPLLIPGERFNRTIVNYLKFAREFNRSFPGFETDSTAGGRGGGRREALLRGLRALRRRVMPLRPWRDVGWKSAAHSTIGRLPGAGGDLSPGGG